MESNNTKTIYSSNHINFFEKIISKKRLEMILVVNDYLKNQKLIDVVDIGTTNDQENPSSNIIIKNLQNFQVYKSISDQRIDKGFFTKCLNKSIVEEFTQIELDEYSSDLVISNATIEHVGNYQNQKKMINNIIKLSKKYFIVITPNRFHPVEPHSKLPFLHWLPKTVHRKLLSFLGHSILSKEENLNLLSKKDIHQIMSSFQNISYEIKYINFLFLKSNFIIIGKKQYS